MSGKVLHLLSQRPGRTGSGITLEATLREAKRAGWDQTAIVGIPSDEPDPSIGGLPTNRIHPLRFEEGKLDFPLPGMSDVMPYHSSRWSSLSRGQLDQYRQAWRLHIGEILRRENPDIIHSHHIWLMSSLLPDLAGGRPIVLQCHATGLRQMELCPHLADEVRDGCSRADRFIALHEDHVALLESELGVSRSAIDQIGSGYRDDLFHTRGRVKRPGHTLLYVGKYSAAKGLPQLLDVMEQMGDVKLHVAGSGSGSEADSIRRRMEGNGAVTLHGQIDQADLARLMRRCDVCVLPSFYEGVPLVLVEAAACGCRLVSTDLPGIRNVLAPVLGRTILLVDPPPMEGIDRPAANALPHFVDRLGTAIRTALTCTLPPVDTSMFAWNSIFMQVESAWRSALAEKGWNGVESE